MQHASDSTSGSAEAAPTSLPSPFLSRETLKSPPQFIGSSGEFVNFYPSGFASDQAPSLPASTQLRRSTSVSLTPSSVSYEEEVEGTMATDHRLYLARLTLQHEEMLDRYELCLSHLEDAIAEAEALRLENAKLRIANAELARLLSFSSSFSMRGRGGGGMMEAAASADYRSNLLNEFHRLQLSSDWSSSDLSPPSAPDYHHLQNWLPSKSPFPEHRTTLPKSISIRSSGYMKLAASNRNGRVCVSDPVLLGPQMAYVPVGADECGGGGDGRKKEKEVAPLELEVCAQGMFKTELCNKWQETGSCPYGEQCQFAHGIAELRPVIRHPRYKTEICRMILTGGTCPYGHRCHFRHGVNPQDPTLPAHTF